MFCLKHTSGLPQGIFMGLVLWIFCTLGAQAQFEFRMSLSAQGGDPTGELSEPLSFDGDQFGVYRVSNSSDLYVKTYIGMNQPRWEASIARSQPNMPLRAGVFGQGSTEPPWVPDTIVSITSPKGITAVSYRTEIKYFNPETQALWVLFEARVSGQEGVVVGEIRSGLGNPPSVPKNIGPAVACSDKRVPFVSSVTHVPIEGYADDDSPNFYKEWRVKSGPGRVTFADRFSPHTTATFSVPGTYELTLFASDSTNWRYTAQTSMRIGLYVPQISLVEETYTYEGAGQGFSRTESKAYASENEDMFVTMSDKGVIQLLSRKSLEFGPPADAKLQTGQTYFIGSKTAQAQRGSMTELTWPAPAPRFDHVDCIDGFTVDHLNVESGTLVSCVITYWTENEARTTWKVGRLRYKMMDQEPLVAALAVSNRRTCAQNEPVWLACLGLGEAEPALVYWEQISGPRSAVIENPNSRFTRATMSAAGTFRFQVTIDRDGTRDSKEITVEQTEDQSLLAARFDALRASQQKALYRSGPDLELLAVGDASKSRVKIFAPGGQVMILGTPDASPLEVGHPYQIDTPIWLNHREWDSVDTGKSQFIIESIQWTDEGRLRSVSARFSQSIFWNNDREGRVRYLCGPDALNHAPSITSFKASGKHLRINQRIEFMATVEDDLLPYNTALRSLIEVFDPTNTYTSNPAASVHGESFVFSKPGVYRVRMTVTDEEGLSASAEDEVLVGQPATGSFQGVVLLDGFTEGVVQLRCLPNGSLSGKIRIANFTLPFSGGYAQYFERTWPLADGGQLLLKLQPGIDGNSIEGTLSDGEFTFTFSAVQAMQGYLRGTGKSITHAGQYNVALGTDSSPGAPLGRGFARMNISKDGRVRFSGVLADGAPIGFSADVSLNETIRVWVPRYQPTYGLGGTISLLEEHCFSVLEWARPATKKGPYRQGFFVPLCLVATRYQPPPKKSGVFSQNLNSSAGSFDLACESWSQSDVRRFNLPSSNRATFDPPNGNLRMEISPATGLFKGSFLELGVDRVRKFRGIVLREFGGAGFFLTEDYSGSVEF